MSIKRKYLKLLEKIENTNDIKEILEMMRREIKHYNWVGVYLVKDKKELRLLTFSGDKETEHKVIPIEKGICGMAVREKRIVNVYDVSSDPNYLQCFPETKSELVVPIYKDGEIIGEIDIDSNELGAFDENDEWFVSKVSEKIAKILPI